MVSNQKMTIGLFEAEKLEETNLQTSTFGLNILIFIQEEN